MSDLTLFQPFFQVKVICGTCGQLFWTRGRWLKQDDGGLKAQILGKACPFCGELGYVILDAWDALKALPKDIRDKVKEKNPELFAKR